MWYRWYYAYGCGRELVCRILPFLLLFYFNLRILLTYRQTKRDRMNRVSKSQRRGLEEKGEREERRLWQLLLGVVSVFFFCTIPAAPFTVFIKDELDHHFWFQVPSNHSPIQRYPKLASLQLFRAITNMLEFTKFTLNFYLVCSTSIWFSRN